MSVKDMKGRKVLIVEDERRIARFLQMERHRGLHINGKKGKIELDFLFDEGGFFL